MHRYLILFAFTAGALAQTTESAEADIRRLIEIGGGASAFDQFLSAEKMEAQMRTLMKPETVPVERRPLVERFIKEYSAEFVVEAKRRAPELIEQIAGIYRKHYTPEDIKGLLAFFSTPLGKRLASVGAQLQMEVLQTSVGWGQKIGEPLAARVGQRIEAEEAAKKKPAGN